MNKSIYCVMPLVVSACGLQPDSTDAQEPSEEVAVTSEAITQAATASLNFTSIWATGYCAEVTVRNAGTSPTATWTVRINMQAASFNARWNGTFAQSGSTLTITPSGNASIPPGGIASPKPGFCAQRPAGTSLPSILSASGEYCGTLYRDADGDGYGNPSNSIYTCANPAGYVKSAQDRCDADSRVHPGVTTYYSTPNACGTYDYDSNGVETKKSNGPTGCIETPMQCVLNATRTACDAVAIGRLPAACNGQFTSYYTGQCGQRWSFASKGCSFDPSGPSCAMWTSDGIGIAQECR